MDPHSEDAAAPLVDAALGEHWNPLGDALIEVPVLTECQLGGRCSSGLWFIAQAIPSDVEHFDPGWNAADGMGRFTWTVSGRALGPVDGTQPRELSVTVDESPPDVATGPTVQTDALRVPLNPNVTRVVEATIRVPDRARPADGPDALRASVVVAHWYGHGVEVTSWLEGEGARPLRGRARGDGTANLVAHPFGSCPPDRACEVRVRLLARFAPDPRSSSGREAVSIWRLSLLGVPDGTTVNFSPPFDESESTLPGIPGGLLQPWLWLLIGGAAVVLLIAYRIWRRPRRA